MLLPGVTHWQHPRFFAYFATTASPPGIIAELIAATLNQVAFIWRTSPAATELEYLVVDWLADLLGLRRAGTGTSRTAHRPRRSPRSPLLGTRTDAA